MGIRDHQLDPAQAAAGELAQELGPNRFGYRVGREEADLGDLRV
jgi:hypothetical protein